MKPIFSKIKVNRPGRNAFDLSHERKLSFNMGTLIPILLQETVPGDKFRVNSEIFLRLAPLVAPIMHRVNVYVHYFFVPYRLLWDEWEEFITGGVDGTATPNMPMIVLADGDEALLRPGTLLDHMGVPCSSTFNIAQGNQLQINAMPFRAYTKIYNEYYRDQTLNEEAIVNKTGGAVGSTEKDEITSIRYRSWEKDYFTSALPWAQRGGEVLLPTTIQYLEDAELFIQPGQGTPQAGGLSVAGNNMEDGANNHLSVQNIDNLEITINDLRRSTKLQEWLERNARAGSRYVEQIFAHFGVKSSDARLQRPEFLGGSKQPVVISEVLNTTSIEGEVPQGNMAGHGISVGKTYAFNKFFEEHGFVIGIMSVLPRTAYYQGLPKIFNKFDKFDYYFPEFANLGEQPVYNKELYWQVDSNVAQNDLVFGYQSRYAEYKFNNSSVHGDFRESLNHWHMARKFDALPGLDNTFVQSQPALRIFAVTDPNIDHLYCQIYNDIKAIRPMPVFGTPSI